MKSCYVLLFLCTLNWYLPYSRADKNTEQGDVEALPWIIRQIVFLPIVRSGLFGLFRDLSKPQTYGVTNAANYRISSEEGGSLGAWYMWPETGMKELSMLGRNDTLIVYMHGNSASRGFGHRIQLYKLLNQLGYYVLSFDYRGYGDSSEIKLCERSVVEDGINVLKWVTNQFNGTRNDSMSSMEEPMVIVWGHSLGTAIATHTLSKWNNTQGIRVSGLVLESPFNTMEDEVKHFSVGRMLSNVLDVSSKLKAADTEFRSNDYLQEVEQPTLILHSEDDPIVPSALGEKLFNSAVEAGKTNIRFKKFSENYFLRHRYMYRAPGIEKYIQELWNSSSEYRQSLESF